MKQVFRRVQDGKGIVQVKDLPAPKCSDNRVLVATEYTAISAGTEGATLGKTFPELVKQTLSDPWMRNAVKNLIFGASPEVTKNIVWDETTLMRAIGYSGAGTVIGIGNSVKDFKVGDRVAFAAEGHAEIVAPGKNHVVPIPDDVTSQQASIVTIGGIAMQGVRRADIQLGERVAIIGLGLVGNLVSQLVHAAGGHVIGVDVDDRRLEEVKNLIPSAELLNSSNYEPVNAVRTLSGGYGADCVIICTASSKPDIANQAMKMARKQGKVVFVGLVKMDLERMPFFQGELDLRFSRAYGPGVMDPDYEAGRLEYPRQFVRWTQRDNLAEFLRLIEQKRIDVDPLIGGAFDVNDAQQAYDQLYSGELGRPVALLHYPNSQAATAHSVALKPRKKLGADKIRLGVIGVGNFSRTTHLPNIDSLAGLELAAIASATGTSAVSVAERFAASYSTTDVGEILDDEAIDAVLIATRHDLHAEYACRALERGKHVFVEKPAVLSFAELERVQSALSSSDCVYMIGYNRRYSALAEALKTQLNAGLPMMIQYQVSVPNIPEDHWTLNATEGGGRLIGEAEHFFDFLNFLVGEPPDSVGARCLALESENLANQYNFAVDLQFGDRALANVLYTSYAAATTPREQVTVHQGGNSWLITDFKSLTTNGPIAKGKRKLFSDLGHKKTLEEFSARIRGKSDGSDHDLAAARVSLQANASLTTEALKMKTIGLQTENE